MRYIPTAKMSRKYFEILLRATRCCLFCEETLPSNSVARNVPIVEITGKVSYTCHINKIAKE